jgi:hypothetical protein
MSQAHSRLGFTLESFSKASMNQLMKIFRFSFLISPAFQGVNLESPAEFQD